jgi:hypothetical protein
MNASYGFSQRRSTIIRLLLSLAVMVITLLASSVQPGMTRGQTAADADTPPIRFPEIRTPEAISYLEIAPDGPDQMPVIFIHGFKDDGVPWARVDPLPNPVSWAWQTEQCRNASDDTPAGFFSNAGIRNWAVQWWSSDNGNPYSSYEEGFAFLMSPEELRASADWQAGTWQSQSYPCPGLLNRTVTYPRSDPQYPDRSFLAIRNTYNDSGRVGDQAQDLLDMLRYERLAGDLIEYRQVNLITHSKGSLVARAMLHMGAESSLADGEYVANVIYNAPPFAGSTIAQLGTELYLPPVVDGSIFASPWFVNSYGSLASYSSDMTVGEIVERFLDDYLQFATFGVAGLEDALQVSPPGTRLVLETFKDLTSYPVTASFDWVAFSQSPEAHTLAVAFITPMRELVSVLFGLPAFPTLNENLTPAGGADHLRTYMTSPHVHQFVTYGRGGIDRSLFPCVPSAETLPCAQAVADNPDLLTDIDNLSLNEDDLAVPEGSALLLTQSDAWGQPMRLLGVASGDFDTFDHGGMLYSEVETLGPYWLSVFLAAPTTLQLSGAIDLIDAAQRSYTVSEDTSFAFQSRSVSTQGVTVTATEHEYRVVRADNSGLLPSQWFSVAPGAAAVFSDLRDAVGLNPKGESFYLEWRSVNEAGGREMIRTARLVIEPAAPQVVSEVMIGAEDEYYRRPRHSLVGGNATRPSFFDVAPGIGDQLAAITGAPESSWVVSNQAGKGLMLVFDHRGHVAYAWDDPGFSATTTLRDVHCLCLELEELTDGLHTLSYETFNDLGERTPRQHVNILVDNAPPLVSLFYQSDHSLGYVVGPQTPLRFEVQDLETEGGGGSLTVPGHPAGAVPANSTFTLAETNLEEVGRDAGLVGVAVTLTANAVDLVGNRHTEEIEVYYDWTAPAISLESIAGTVPVGVGSYRAYTDTLTLVVEVSDGPSPTAQTTTGAGGMWASAPFVLQSGRQFQGEVRLSPGENTVTIRSEDVVGNVGSLNLNITYEPNDPDTEPLAILSPRLQIPNCLNDSGNVVLCTNGAIEGVAPSFYGDVFLFHSLGNKWVANDTNADYDVFAAREGEITLVSASVDSTIGNNDSQHAAISGDGRYAFFHSFATNLVPGTSGLNLYVKELETGEIAVVSRKANGEPSNWGGVSSFQKTAVTFTGRYVFFESQANNHVSGYSDTNNRRDIFVADLDPDGNGSFFDDNYVIYPISTASATAMGNGESRNPDVSSDGRYLVYETQATDIGDTTIESALGSNGTITDILLVEFAGSAEDGTLDPTTRTLTPINTSHFLGNGGTLTPWDARNPRIYPLDDLVVIFATRANIEGTGDTNSESLGTDIYASHRTGNPDVRFVEWLSMGVGGTQSSENINSPISELSVGLEQSVTEFEGAKKTWVSLHDNLVAGDTNGVSDLFILGQTGASNLPVINWIDDDPLLPSSAAVNEGGVTPDGRYAFWVSTQEYTAPFGSGVPNLYLRRIEQPLTNILIIEVVGNGVVGRAPVGTANGAAFDYPDTAQPTLVAVPDTGWRFSGWQGIDSSSGEVAQVAMHHDRVVTATFTAMQAPTSVGAVITTDEDTPSQGTAPAVVDPDPGDTHTFTIHTQPAHGTAAVRDNRLVYTPHPNFAGSDSFTFLATDSAGLFLEGMAQVTVRPVPDAPTVAPLSITTVQNRASSPVAPAVSDPDADESFTLSVQIAPQHGSMSIVVDASDQRFIYTPAKDYHGPDNFTFLVTDASGLSTTGIATVTVTESGPSEWLFLPLIMR